MLFFVMLLPAAAQYQWSEEEILFAEAAGLDIPDGVFAEGRQLYTDRSAMTGFSGYPGITYDGISPPEILNYDYAGCGLEGGKCMCSPNGAGSMWSGGRIPSYGAEAVMTQEICDELVANSSVSKSGKAVTGPFYDGTSGNSCAGKCEEPDLMRPSGDGSTMVAKGNVGGCYQVPTHGACSCHLTIDECNDLGGLWMWNCWSPSRNATMCNAFTSGCKVADDDSEGCICHEPCTLASGRSSNCPITKAHADELIVNGTCKRWSHMCDNNCTKGHGCYGGGGCTCETDKQTCDTMVADGDAIMWSFSCGGGPVAGMTHERHLCTDLGYAGHGGHGGGSHSGGSTTDDATTTNSSNATDDAMDSNTARFGVLAVLFYTCA